MVKRWLGTVIFAAAVVLLSACGGGGDSPPTTPAPAADLPIGPAGGTVSHASGAAVVVPAGALTTDTTIRVAMDSTGAPALPAALVAAGNTYVVTPHGSEFAEPAEVRIPVGAVALLPNQVLKLAKAQPGGEWEVLDDSSVQGGVVSAKVGSFSYFMPVTVTYLLPIFQAEPLQVTASTLTCGAQPCSPAFGTITATYTVVANNGQLPSSCTDRLLTLQGGTSTSFDASSFGAGVNVPLSGGSATTTLPVRQGSFYFKVGIRCTGFTLNSYSFRRTVFWPNTPTYPEMVIHRAPAQLDVVAGASASMQVVLSGAAAREQTSGSNTFTRPSVVDRAVIDWQRSDDGGTSWRTVARTLQDEAQPEPDGPGVPWRYWGVRHGFIAAASDHGALIRAYACYTPPDVPAPPCVRSSPTRLNVVQQGMAPAILEAPRSVLVQTGQTVSFSARAGGLPTPTLQWQTRAANSSGAWADVSSGTGATSDSFTTPPVLLADNGRQYRVVASNAMGSAESAAVTVSVSDLDVAPFITTQPAALSVAVDSDAAFAIAARGTEALSYQWRFNGAPITGANNPVLRLPAVTSAQAGSYTITVTNTAGTVTSNAAMLAVGAGAPAAAAPVIVTQPVSVVINTGNTATFAVGVRSTSALAYQWMRNGQPITGATAAFYSIAQAALGDAATYRVQVSNGVGPAIFSDNVTLTVNAGAQSTPLALASQPSPQVQAPGGTATFAVAATGSGPITYQWLKNGVAIPGASGAVLTFGSVAGSDAGSYAVTVSNGSTTLTSDAASLVVLGMPVITTQPASASAGVGATATFGVAADGSLLRYQWTRNGVAIPGAVGASYTTPALALGDSGAVYGVVVYNGAGVAFSQGAVLSVTPAVIAGWQGAPEMLGGSTQYGAMPALATYGADAVGSDKSALAVWTQYEPIAKIYANRFVPGSGWAGRVEVSTHTASTQAANYAQVTTNALNQSIVVWQLQDDVANTRTAVARRYTPAGGWEAPVTLSSGVLYGGEAMAIQVKADARGNAVATWSQRTTAYAPWQLFAARFDAGTGWSAALRLDNGAIGEPGDYPQVAVGPAGHAFVLWSAPGTAGGTTRLWSRRMGADGTWDPAVLLGEPPLSLIDLSIAVNDVGDALAVWRQYDNPSFTSIWSQFHRNGVGWGSALAAETDNFNRATSPKVVAQGGLWLAMWVQYTAAGEQVLVNRYSATVGEGWGATAQVIATGAINSFGSPSIALSSSGAAVVAWRANYGIWASMRAPSGAWAAPQQAALTAADGTGYSAAADPQAGIDSLGNATVVWEGAPGVSGNRIYAGRFR